MIIIKFLIVIIVIIIIIVIIVAIITITITTYIHYYHQYINSQDFEQKLDDTFKLNESREMILESNILELLIERDTLKSIQNDQNKQYEEIRSNCIQTLENKKNILSDDGLMIVSNEEEQSSGSIVMQENDLMQKGKNALLRYLDIMLL